MQLTRPARPSPCSPIPCSRSRAASTAPRWTPRLQPYPNSYRNPFPFPFPFPYADPDPDPDPYPYPYP